MMQGALSKERREQKMMERQAADAATAAEQGGSQKGWHDPIAARNTESTIGGGDPGGMGKMGPPGADMPEWKKHIISGAKGSFGRKTNMSILEQRQSLPIYKLKDELIKAINDNQVSARAYIPSTLFSSIQAFPFSIFLGLF